MIRELLPSVVADIFPYRIILQPSELQISGVQHESFHVAQAAFAPDKFAEADTVYEVGERYWDKDAEMQSAWVEEIDLLIDAVDAASAGDAAEIGRQFLVQRDQRRQDHELNAELVTYEVQLEWLEGTAKYVELRSWEEANSSKTYVPISGMENDPDFKYYETFESRWDQELRTTREHATREGDTRFYYSGMLQAYLLDYLMPDWKERIFEDGVYLEDLLREAIAQ
jgi:hypothetical protein